MAARLPSRRDEVIGFAHRGARAHAPENTIEAFELALRLGATGLESDVWLTADGHAVLDHDGVVGRPWRRTPLSQVRRDELPAHIPTLEELYSTCGSDFELSLDVKDPEALSEVLATVRRTSRDAEGRLWLCHPDWRLVASWRSETGTAHLVDSTRRKHLDGGPERRAAELAAAGVDAINMHHTDWTGGLVTLFHRFEIDVLAWDCQHDRVLREVLDMGVDGIFSDHVDRMVEALAAMT